MAGLQAHLLGNVCRKRRTPTQVAEENKLFLLGKHGMVVGAFRVDLEFEQAARAVEGARYPAITFQLPDVTQVDEDHIIRV